MAQHTPGPWHVEQYRETLEVWAPGRHCERRIAELALPLTGQEQTAADARLVAAAPALRAFAQLVSDFFTDASIGHAQYLKGQADRVLALAA